MRWPKLVRGIRVLTGLTGITGDSLNEKDQLNVSSCLSRSLHSLSLHSTSHSEGVNSYLLYRSAGFGGNGRTLTQCFQCLPGAVTSKSSPSNRVSLCKALANRMRRSGRDLEVVTQTADPWVCPSSIQPHEGARWTSMTEWVHLHTGWTQAEHLTLKTSDQHNLQLISPNY